MAAESIVNAASPSQSDIVTFVAPSFLRGDLVKRVGLSGQGARRRMWLNSGGGNELGYGLTDDGAKSAASIIPNNTRYKYSRRGTVVSRAWRKVPALRSLTVEQTARRHSVGQLLKRAEALHGEDTTIQTLKKAACRGSEDGQVAGS